MQKHEILLRSESKKTSSEADSSLVESNETPAENQTEDVQVKVKKSYSEKDMTRLPTKADKYAGMRLRNLRIQKGLSQRDLSGKLGVTFQQIQKYEKGQNRIGIGRLYEICNIMQVGPSYFFEDDTICGNTKKVAESSADISLITELLFTVRTLPEEDQKRVVSYAKDLIKSLNKGSSND